MVSGIFALFSYSLYQLGKKIKHFSMPLFCPFKRLCASWGYALLGWEPHCYTFWECSLNDHCPWHFVYDIVVIHKIVVVTVNQRLVNTTATITSRDKDNKCIRQHLTDHTLNTAPTTRCYLRFTVHNQVDFLLSNLC